MDKPLSMSDKDYLIRVMSIKTNTPVAIIDAVISHQFEAANEALKTNNTIELSGFGKFVFKLKKAQNKLQRNINKKEYWEKALEDTSLTEQKRQSYTNKLNNTIKEIEVLKTKLKVE